MRKATSEEMFREACYKCAYAIYKRYEEEYILVRFNVYHKCCRSYPDVIAAFDKLDFAAPVKEIIWKYL